MQKHLAVLQKWDGDRDESLILRYPVERLEECKSTLEKLRRDAHKRKVPVTYRMTELPGEFEYSGKSFDEQLKSEGTTSLIFTGGEVYKGNPLFIQKDNKNGK